MALMNCCQASSFLLAETSHLSFILIYSTITSYFPAAGEVHQLHHHFNLLMF